MVSTDRLLGSSGPGYATPTEAIRALGYQGPFAKNGDSFVEGPLESPLATFVVIQLDDKSWGVTTITVAGPCG